MRRSQSVKRFVSSTHAAVLVLVAVTVVATSALATSTEQIRCSAHGDTAGLPHKVGFKIVSVEEIEVAVTHKGQPETAAVVSTRVDVATHPHVAVFPVGQNLGVTLGITGDARILLSKEALRLGEVSTLLLINPTSRQSAAYQCRRSI